MTILKKRFFYCLIIFGFFLVLISFSTVINLKISGDSYFHFSNFNTGQDKWIKFAFFFLLLIGIFPLIFISLWEILVCHKQFGYVIKKQDKKAIGFLSLATITPNFYWLFAISLMPNELNIKVVRYFALVCFFGIVAFILLIYLLTKNGYIYEQIKHKKPLFILGFFFWNFLIYITLINGPVALVMLLIIVWSNDTVAYIVGSKYGKKKISPFSPNKTLEGLLAGIAAGVAPIIIWYILSVHFSGEDDFQKITSTFFVGKEPRIWDILFLIFAANFGDQFYSKYKRKMNIKDYGSLLGPHGGFWDRFDSLNFALISFVITAVWK